MDLNKEIVVKYVGKYIKSKFGDIPFAIAGSYAASVAAYEHDASFCMKFNDIDVYIKHQGPRNKNKKNEWEWSGVGEYEEGAIPNLVSIKDVKNVIPGSNTVVNLISLDANGIEGEFVSLEGLIRGFDINAVMTGFVAKWSRSDRKYKIHRELARVHFNRFLYSRILEIPALEKLSRPVSAFIRLLYKAQQLKLDYNLPEEFELLGTLDGRCCGEPTKKKLAKLRGKYKKEFTSRFFFAQSFYSSKFKMQLYKLGRI